MEKRVDYSSYLGVDRHYFETPGCRSIEDQDFSDLVGSLIARRRRKTMPPMRYKVWDMERAGIWMHCRPEGIVLPAQGWKIHVSSVDSTSRIVLSIVAAMLVERGVAFKFAADLRFLRTINSKRCPRSSSGKFMTIYPRDVHEFRSVMEDLHASLSGYVGPAVFTDRSYGESHVLHYRYGGIRSDFRIRPDARREWLLTAPDGSKVADARAPFYWLPDWLKDPFGDEPAASQTTAIALGGGRFRVHKALAFSAAGGVYLADDLHSGKRVVVKEARPYVGEGTGATATLRKEFRLLRRLAPLDVAPQAFAHFRDWEHTFLVEAFLEGDTLRTWLVQRYPWLKTRATRADVLIFLRAVCKVFTHLADAMGRVHAEGISIGDLSFDNCIVDAEGKVRLIDLEAAIEHGMDEPVDLRTPGFASSSPQRSDLASAMTEDYYAFGANLLAAVIPVNAMTALDASAASRFVAAMVRDMGYPAVLVDVVGELMASNPVRRPRPQDAMIRLREAVLQMDDGNLPVPHRHVERSAVCAPTNELLRFIRARATEARDDRFVPADIAVFETHPWGVAHGAAGVLHACQRISDDIPAEWRSYLIKGATGQRPRGASLMAGDTGIAWVLYDLGECDLADELLDRLSGMASSEWTDHGLHDGLAGWGLGRIKAWHATSRASFLDEAREAGNVLLQAATWNEHGLCWHTGEQTPVGLGSGASGVALFLMHLHVATGEQRFLKAAREALAFDFAQRRLNPDGDPTWPVTLGRPMTQPYLASGTAGIVAVAARMFVVTGDEHYQDMVLTAEADLFRHHAIHPGLFDGLAGVGETLLDLATFFPERSAIYLREAHKVAMGIEPFLIRRPDGLATPGTRLLRLSCDFATGSAGVAKFFHRLREGGQASFMLDEHLPSMADAQCMAFA